MLRVAAAFGRAVLRQQLREVVARRVDVELVLVSATVSAVRARLLADGVDICLVDPDLPEIDLLVRDAQRSGTPVVALLQAGDAAAVARRLGMRPAHVHTVDGEGDLVELLAGLPNELSSSPGTPTSTDRAPARGPAGTKGLLRRSATVGAADVLVIGSSTGGPDALTTFFAGLPAWFDLPILIVQHMPPRFTAMLAKSLCKASHLRVGEADDGTTFGRGEAWLAPGGMHMEVSSPGRLALHDQPPVNSCRPSADVLFRSVASVYGRRAVALVLTGMGNDGAAGCEAMHRVGAKVVVQDESSSVVWGMPGAVVAAGVADQVVPLDRMAETALVHLGLVDPRRGVVAR